MYKKCKFTEYTSYRCQQSKCGSTVVTCSDVNQIFGLGLASVLLTWPRKCAIQCNITSVVSIPWLYHCNIHYKDVVKYANVGHKVSYALLALSPCVLRNIMWPASTLASASSFSPRLTTLVKCRLTPKNSTYTLKIETFKIQHLKGG